MNLSVLLSNVSNFHIKIAKCVYPDGLTLICKTCGMTIEATTEDCAGYLAHGWPKCHGREMSQLYSPLVQPAPSPANQEENKEENK
jgi:hypothetical protein